jgi:hypothetical protein
MFLTDFNHVVIPPKLATLTGDGVIMQPALDLCRDFLCF